MLTSWAKQRTDSAADLGPAVLSVLLSADSSAHDAVRSALPVWLANAVRPARHPGLHGGMAGVLTGTRLIAGLHPPANRLVERVKGWLVTSISEQPWRDERVRFVDYDLISGSAGVTLAGVGQARQHLESLGLSGLRIGGHTGDPLVEWMQGGLNTGLAHGVPGVLTALPAPELVDWLIAESYRDELGVVSWSPRAREGAEPVSGVMRRQAWCYGTPGVAWALWSAGACSAAVEAMRSCCAAYDFDVHLYGSAADRLGICHGAAGVLLVADAFARHAELAEAAELRDRLVRYLADRMDQVMELDHSLLMGATGVLSALLTAAGGARDWLVCLGLR